MLRAKMRVSSVTHEIGADGKPIRENLVLLPVTGDSAENKQWSKYTPGGQLQLTIDNPSAIGKVLPGREYFVDVDPAD